MNVDVNEYGELVYYDVLYVFCSNYRNGMTFSFNKLPDDGEKFRNLFSSDEFVCAKLGVVRWDKKENGNPSDQLKIGNCNTNVINLYGRNYRTITCVVDKCTFIEINEQTRSSFIKYRDEKDNKRGKYELSKVQLPDCFFEAINNAFLK